MATLMLCEYRAENGMSSNTVGAMLDTWGNVQGLGKRPRTRQFHEQIIATIKKHLPDKSANELTESDVILFGQRVDGYCPSRWNAMVSALRSVTDKARILKRRKLRFREFTPPTQQEFSRVLSECDSITRSDVGLIVRFFSLTGVRFCEARRLKPDNIGADCVNVSATVSKNGRARSIPFLPGVAEVVEKLRARTYGSEFLIPKPHIRRALETACERAGIPSLSYHALRHIFATRCIESGVDVPTVARWLGHSDGGSLLSRMYFHLCSPHSREMAGRVKIL